MTGYVDALYSLQALVKPSNTPPKLDRLLSGAEFLDRVCGCGMGDGERLAEAAALLHAFSVVIASMSVSEERQRVRRLIAAVTDLGK